jgi:hypothetical protein
MNLVLGRDNGIFSVDTARTAQKTKKLGEYRQQGDLTNPLFFQNKESGLRKGFFTPRFEPESSLELLIPVMC